MNLSSANFNNLWLYNKLTVRLLNETLGWRLNLNVRPPHNFILQRLFVNYSFLQLLLSPLKDGFIRTETNLPVSIHQNLGVQ